MYSHTRKVGSLGRYGVRLGRKLRYGALKIENEAKTQKNCPSCIKGKIRRMGAGIWKCKSCGHTFTGGAHLPVVKRVVKEEAEEQ